MLAYVDEALKELAKETADVTQPEAFHIWCKKIAPHFNRTWSALEKALNNRLKEIHEITYLDNLQKVQLLFVFRRFVPQSFAKVLRKEGHKIELDSKKRHILSFRSSDGKYIRIRKSFFRRPTKGSQDAQGPSPSDQDAENDDASLAEADGPSSSGSHDVPADGSTSEQKPIVPSDPDTSNFPVFVSLRVKKEPIDDFEQNIEARPILSTVHEGSIAPPVREGTTSSKRRQEEPGTMDAKRPKPSNGPAENSRSTPLVVPVSEGEGAQRIKEKPASVQSTPQQYSDVQEGSVSAPQNANAVPTPSTSTSKSPDSTIPVVAAETTSETSVLSVGLSTPTAPRDSVGHPLTPPAVVTPAPGNRHISALKLADQIEATAASSGLHDLQSKAARIVQELEIQDKTICPRKFHRTVVAVAALSDEEKMSNHEDKSVGVKQFLNTLRLSVIRNLGRDLVANSLVYIEKKIKQLEEENNEEVLPIELIKENLESLLELATNN